MKIKTILGDMDETEIGITLPHEHICCYSEYLYQMAGNLYLDKATLCRNSIEYLRELKEKYSLRTFVDCTPVNIGRDVDLLKRVSEESGVNIICSTGFYYTEETLLHNMHTNCIVDYLVADATAVNAGIIKCAVENEIISTYDEKILRASAKAQLQLGLPIVLHTNAHNQNGIKALDILVSEGVKAQSITVSHLSDTHNIEYIEQIANYGCFIGFDRLYDDMTKEYIAKTVEKIEILCNKGYTDKLLLSHDASFFNGFEEIPAINERPRYSYYFDYILPELSKEVVEKITYLNPTKMLIGGTVI